MMSFVQVVVHGKRGWRGGSQGSNIRGQPLGPQASASLFVRVMGDQYPVIFFVVMPPHN